VLAALPDANPWAVRERVATLRSVSTVQSWLGWLANGGRRATERIRRRGHRAGVMTGAGPAQHRPLALGPGFGGSCRTSGF
jgi:hypothetical protein